MSDTAKQEAEDIGLTIDMLDVDRLRQWAQLLLNHGSDISHWASVPFVVSTMQTLATNLEKAVRDVGVLRAALHGSEAGPQEAREEVCGNFTPLKDGLRAPTIADHYGHGWQAGRATDPLKGIRDAKYLNPVCSENGCQWLNAGSEAGVSARVLELATKAAFDAHKRHVKGHEKEPFGVCTHPDCVLVRAALGVSPAVESK